VFTYLIVLFFQETAFDLSLVDDNVVRTWYLCHVERFESGNGNQRQRHREHTASSRHAQVLERKTSCPQETGKQQLYRAYL